MCITANIIQAIGFKSMSHKSDINIIRSKRLENENRLLVTVAKRISA